MFMIIIILPWYNDKTNNSLGEQRVKICVIAVNVLSLFILCKTKICRY